MESYNEIQTLRDILKKSKKSANYALAYLVAFKAAESGSEVPNEVFKSFLAQLDESDKASGQD